MHVALIPFEFFLLLLPCKLTTTSSLYCILKQITDNGIQLIPITLHRLSSSHSWSAAVLTSPQLHCTTPSLRFLPTPKPKPPDHSSHLPFHQLPLIDAYAEAFTPSPQRVTSPHVFCDVAPMALSVHTIYVHVYLYIHTRPYFGIDHTFTYIYICRYDMCSYVYMYEMLHHMLHRHLVNLHGRVRTNILFSSRNAAADVRGHT